MGRDLAGGFSTLCLLLVCSGLHAAGTSVQHRLSASSRVQQSAIDEEDIDALINSANFQSDLASLDASSSALPSDDAVRHASADLILHGQLEQVKKCFTVLYNASLPMVVDRFYFPKNNSRPQRFHYHCQKSTQPEEGTALHVLEPTFLSSYNVDGVYMPEWVAFKIERPVFGMSYVPKTSRKDCQKKGGEKFFQVMDNGIQTPDAAFTVDYNLKLLHAGRDIREGIQKGQVCLPTNFLTCYEKEGTYAMTNVVPLNRYLYTMNLAEADKALRKYVAVDVDMPRPGMEDIDLHSSPKYQPVFVVAGPHFNQAQTEKFDWCYETEDPMNIGSLKKGFIPHAYWQAVVNPAKVELAPRQAAIAWYCNNRPDGPWPNKATANQYENGPKLCRVMSLSKLEKIAGVRPFPDLPKKVRDAKPIPAIWNLSELF